MDDDDHHHHHTSAQQIYRTDRVGAHSFALARTHAQAYAPNCVGIFIFLSPISLIVISFSLRVLVIFCHRCVTSFAFFQGIAWNDAFKRCLRVRTREKKKQNPNSFWFYLSNMHKLWLCVWPFVLRSQTSFWMATIMNSLLMHMRHTYIDI